MPAVDSTLFGLLSGKSRWLAQRQTLLAQNVANSDTPDYRPWDMRPAGFEELMRSSGGMPAGLSLATTSTAHLGAEVTAAGVFDDGQVDGFETAPAGNAVVLPEQLAKMAHTQLDFELTTNLYRRYVALMKTALGSSQG